MTDTYEPMDLSGLERSALEMYAGNLDAALENAERQRARLEVDNDALRAALGDVEQLAQRAAATGDLESARRAASLARLVRLDRSNLEDDE